MRISLIYLMAAILCLGVFSEALILKHLAKKAFLVGKALKAEKALKAAKAVKAAKALALPILGAKAAILKKVAVKGSLAKAGLAKAAFFKPQPQYYPIPVAPLIPIALAQPYAFPPPPPPALEVAEVVSVPKEPVLNVDEILTAWDATSTAVSNHLGRFGHRVQSYIPFAGSVSVSAPAASVDIELGSPPPARVFTYPALAPPL